MKPLDLTEDRSPEQLAADGDEPAAEPVPCGSIASVTHCCEYHAIHSDDDFAAAAALARDINGFGFLFTVGVQDRINALANQPAAPTRTEAEEYDLQAGGRGLSLEEVRAMYPAAPTRTEAEQAVLDAMREARIDHDGWFIDATTEQAAGRAELARRGRKP